MPPAGATAAAAVLVPQIHHEKQEPGSMLCAQHALNALLQGNYYDAPQLADIAKRLDALEQDALDESEWGKHLEREAERNMDDTGFFSVGVLEQAIEVWGLRLLRWRSAEMRPFHSKPEEELAFVLNFEAHWFTIRSFPGRYWFNLNSFLPEPSWVGPSYLGALLDAAETEGYSVFVVRPAEGGHSDGFYNSTADDCAATLPPATSLGEGSDGSDVAFAGGLRPDVGSSSRTAGASSSAAGASAFAGAEDEDAELQAALQASLAESGAGRESATAGAGSATLPNVTDLRGGSSTSSASGSAGGGSRGVRRARRSSDDLVDDERALPGGAGFGGAVRGQREVTTSTDEGASTDAAPFSRRRRTARDQQRGQVHVIDDDDDDDGVAGALAVLPTVSGRRRRASRQLGVDEDDETLRRAMEASLASGSGSGRGARQRGVGGSGTSTADAISIDSDEDEGDAGQRGGSGLRSGARGVTGQRSPFLNPALGDLNELGEDDDEDVEDFHSLSSGEAARGQLGGSWSLGPSAAGLDRSDPPQERVYDDEDADLQRALAASMADAGGAGGATAGDDWSGLYATDNDDRLAALLHQERSPTPDDVRNIIKKREEARQKALREARGEASGDERYGADVEGAMDDGQKGGQGEGGEEEEEEKEEEVSPEEMRRRRLARFGA